MNGSRGRLAAVGAVLAALTCLAWAGCERARVSGRRPGPVRIVVSVAPLAGIVKPLAPPGANVVTLVPAGRSLHGYEMTPADLGAIAEADVLVHVGLGLEPALEDVLASHPSATRRVVCFAQAAGAADAGGGHEDHEHAAGEEHEDHDHPHGADPHLWLDPELVSRLIPPLAEEIEQAMRDAGRLTSVDEDRLRHAKFDLMAEVDAINQEYAERLEPFRGAAIVTHHNAFGRLADRYGLKIAAVIRPIEGAEPAPEQIAAAVEAIRREGARAVFFEPQYNTAAAEAIAEAAGVPSGVLDPEGSADWAGLMRANLDSLTRMLGGR